MQRKSQILKEFRGTELPQHIEENTAYILYPNNANDSHYRERTDRNLGWINPVEQDILRNSVVGIAGTGGMGGLLASILVRVGIGEVRISDNEIFDVSNCNRQYAATRKSVGKLKAIETARMIREIANDTTLTVYPQGITEASVDHFVDTCDLVCDEIEAFALSARLLLHAQSRAYAVPVFNCNSVGFSTNLFLYTPSGMSMEEVCGYTYKEAIQLEANIRNGDKNSLEKLLKVQMRTFVPKLPEYRSSKVETDAKSFYERLRQEQRVSIIGTNPIMAAGFLANRVVLYLLKDSPIKRNIVTTPEMPQYLHFDAALMHTCVGQL